MFSSGMAEIEHTQPHRQTFESIRREDDGAEYWRARELAPALGYEKYDNFLQVIRKARIACVQSGMSEADHFADVGKMVDLGSGARRQIADLRLSRWDRFLDFVGEPKYDRHWGLDRLVLLKIGTRGCQQ
ncbi:MAG: hypothetical protein ACK4M2_05385 [Brevundimonas sp.]